VKLYGYWRSSSTWRVRIGLHLKGAAFEVVPVNLLAGDQRDPAHLARNPRGQVPVIELDDGTLLYESLAILAWADAVWPDPPLIPAGPLARARAWQAAEIVNSGIQPLQNLRILQQIDALGGSRVAWARDVIDSGLGGLEALAAETAGRFLVGDAPTIADILLVPQLYNARRFGVDLAPYPTLLAVEAACERLPAFQAAHPDRQPDAGGPA
jgi:maleylpyruvate isomerase